MTINTLFYCGKFHIQSCGPFHTLEHVVRHVPNIITRSTVVRFLLYCSIYFHTESTKTHCQNFDFKIRRDQEKNSMKAASMSRFTIITYLKYCQNLWSLRLNFKIGVTSKWIRHPHCNSHMECPLHLSHYRNMCNFLA